MLASRKGILELVQCLIENNADINARDKNGKTALFHGVEAHHQNPDVVSLLISHGADPNTEADDKYTPLLKAVEKEYCKVVETLVEKGAKLNVSIESSGI